MVFSSLGWWRFITACSCLTLKLHFTFNCISRSISPLARLGATRFLFCAISNSLTPATKSVRDTHRVLWCDLTVARFLLFRPITLHTQYHLTLRVASIQTSQLKNQLAKWTTTAKTATKLTKKTKMTKVCFICVPPAWFNAIFTPGVTLSVILSALIFKLSALSCDQCAEFLSFTATTHTILFLQIYKVYLLWLSILDNWKYYKCS